MASLSPEERQALRDGFRRLLADRCTEKDVRRTMETASGYDPELWDQIAAMGLTGLIVEEAHGGAGAGPLELEAVMEEAGAALLGSPLLSSAVLAAGLIQATGDEAAKARLLPAIADGSLIATAALTGDAGTWTPEGVAVTASPAGNGWQLDGHASFVTDGQNAGKVIVAANGPDGLGLYEVEVSAVEAAPLPTFDHTLRMARLTFAGTESQRIETANAWAAVQQAIDLALVALAGEQAGGAKRVLDFTVDYAKTRIQFGRPIGGFQAVKHMAADILLESESATSAARNAARALANSDPDAETAVALAAFACADAYATVTAQAIQMHGGIAFTWEHPAHLYLRRARAGTQLFGNSNFYRERYLRSLEAAA
jgi:alkylation response protein AidB-like acyl-CoA dehydrogenase